MSALADLLQTSLSQVDWSEVWDATLETLAMTGGSLFFTILLGLPLGILLFLTNRKQLLAQRGVYLALSLLVNVLRSVPFLILLIVLIPFTLWLVGTSLGVTGAIPPLVIGTAPFFARLTESVLREIDRGVIETCTAMGARRRQIIFGALLPEALPGLLAAVTITAITLMSYAAMSGVIGGGGLGDLAIRYGYQRFQTEVMVVTVAILVVLVQLLQFFGDRLVLRFTRK
ncbi:MULTISPECIES: methionine ABC transporter permease [unclassified Herbaspirillum]|uniref:methionine ABC transporter permease n=1 Tax=unclassified Herbaspirillum TaxID=2624150 RepID=UPI00114FE00D|nr:MULTISPECIES: methionine ABC transporter permease [unclassified Herbaspirillum]MBB5391020.1 D-methionine transport system permease protein [Herbaspirillum sp. SJZ102]TQK13280.1 D-methionine transport system permease protein [Herbaspirillum sp. SJZ130]TQK15284.1 D-methionine transport system permease protein [Herbaspirillum sp. SJZ106]